MVRCVFSFVAIATLAAGLSACGGGADSVEGPPPTPVVTSVEISPNPLTLFMGDTAQLSATVKDQNGAAMTGKRVTWASDAPTVATVDTLGRVVAKTSGTANISAAVESKTGSVSLTSTGPGTAGAVTGSAAIGTAGGSVQATLPGGGTLALTLPAGALDSTRTITLEPRVPPPGALASFRLTPAGVTLDKPATLVIKVSSGAKLRSSSRLVIAQGGARIPVKSTLDLNLGTLSVTLSNLGLPATAATASRSATAAMVTAADSSDSATGTVENLTLDDEFAAAQMALDQLTARGTTDAAFRMQLAMEQLTGPVAILDPRWGTLATNWVVKVCGFTGFAFNDMESFGFVSDYRGLERVFVLAILWERARVAMNAVLRAAGAFTCPNPINAQTRINNKLTALQPSIVTDLNGFALEPPPREASFFDDRLRPLVDVASTLAQADFTPEVEIITSILRGQFIRMKSAGWTQCRRNPGSSQNIQGILGRNLALIPLPGVEQHEVQDDIERCGMLINWAVLDTNNAVIGNGIFGAPASAQPGQNTLTGSATLIGNGQLRISSGFLQALLCPAPASQNNEQLEIAGGPNASSQARVAVLSPSTENRYLQSSSLFVNSDTLRKVAGIAPGDTGTVIITIKRIGGNCSGFLGLIAHKTLGTLTLSFKREIRFTFDTDLQGWTGSSFGVADGAPPWALTRWTFQGGKGVVDMDGRDAARDDLPNGSISMSIDLPANVTTLSYELSAHNRPDSHVRYRLVINGQVIRDGVVVNSRVPDFDYATRTVDITAFAGQRVTIQFEQHDNGSNGVFPGQSKHLYIDNIRIR